MVFSSQDGGVLPQAAINKQNTVVSEILRKLKRCLWSRFLSFYAALAVPDEQFPLSARRARTLRRATICPHAAGEPFDTLQTPSETGRSIQHNYIFITPKKRASC
jgi:hypothetical protein